MNKKQKTMFVLRTKPYVGNGTSLWDGYYTGDTYQYEGEIYAVANTPISKAKKYSSRKRAENAVESLENKVCNYLFEVVEIQENQI